MGMFGMDQAYGAETNYQDSQEIMRKKQAMDRMAQQKTTTQMQATLPDAAPAAEGATAAGGGASTTSAVAGGIGMVNQQMGGGDAVSGAASGAATGVSVGGPWGAVIGGVIGGVGGLFSQKAKSEAKKRQAVVDSMKVQMDGARDVAQQEISGYKAGTGSMMSGFGQALS